MWTQVRELWWFLYLQVLPWLQATGRQLQTMWQWVLDIFCLISVVTLFNNSITIVHNSPVTKLVVECVLSAPIKRSQSMLGAFGWTENNDGGWDTTIWLWKWLFCSVKQYMHALRSHLWHRPLLGLLPANYNCCNTVMMSGDWERKKGKQNY